MSGETNRVVRKKLGAIRSRGYSFPIQSRLSALVEQAAARGATRVLGLAVEAIVTHSRVDRLAPVLEGLPAPGLYFALETAGGEAGLIGLDMPLVDHLVEVLAAAEPGPWEARPARTPTAVDAALSAPVIDAVTGDLHAAIAGLAGDLALAPFRRGRVEHAPAGLQHALPDQQYLVLRLNLEIGDDGRTGDACLALPLGWLEPVEEAVRRAGLASGQGESENWRRHMRGVVRITPLELRAVLDRGRMQVAELSRLNVGDVFPLADVTLEDVVLELRTGNGARTVARGRLGAWRRNKAVRLGEPPDPALFAPLAEALGLEIEHE